MIGPLPAHRRREGRLAARALSGHAGAAAVVPAPYLVLDLGRGLDPHQARCRRCLWRSCWRATAREVWAEHARHQRTAHASGRRGGRAGRRGLVARWVR
jgi:hypothetical protein